MTTTEVEYDDETRSRVMAYELFDNLLRCPSCGLPKKICQAMENEFAFEADGPHRCHATTAVVEARHRMGDEVKAPEALMFIPKLRGGVLGG